MDTLQQIRDALAQHFHEAIETDPLLAIAAIGAVERDLAAHQRDAVRTAARTHSWAEIGVAVGVTRQAAHQKFAKDWAETLANEVKSEHRAFKSAKRSGSQDEAAAAKAKRDELIEELKTSGGRGR